MTDVEHPPIAKLVFRELDGGGPATAAELPAGFTVDDYVWLRELVRRYRERLAKSGRVGAFDRIIAPN
jgi:hypothetical protein